MSEQTFTQGDTAPPIKATLKNADGTVCDLTSVDTINFQMRKPEDRRLTVDAECDIPDAIHGKVSYDWGDNDLSVPGEYLGQWEIHWNDGKIQTTYPRNTITVLRQ